MYGYFHAETESKRLNVLYNAKYHCHPYILSTTVPSDMGNEHSSEPLSLCEVYTYYIYMLKLVNPTFIVCMCVCCAIHSGHASGTSVDFATRSQYSGGSGFKLDEKITGMPLIVSVLLVACM